MKLKRIFVGMLVSAMLVSQFGAVVSAEEEGYTDAAPEEGGESSVEKTEEEIAAEEAAKKQAAYDIPADTNSLTGWPQGPNVYAASAIVMDMDSGAILYAKKADDQHYPASITKLLTTIVALENAELTDTVTFSEDSINILSWDDAHIGMQPGEQLSLEDALYAVLLASANEVSYAVAESVGTKMGGGYDTFIEEMNRRAKELGCTGSNWINPNGLHDDQHYTTAHDMAVIASAVYQQEEFRKIMETLEYRIPATNLVDEERVFQQNHRMLWEDSEYYYEYCTGGKTGYTDQSGTTLVTMADNGDMRLAAVVLVDYGVDAYTDTRAMFDYVFENFAKVTVADKETNEYIESFSDKDAYVVLPDGINFSQLDSEITADEDDSERKGTIVYTYEGQAAGSAEVTLTESYYKALEMEFGEATEQERADEAEEESGMLSVILAVAAAVVGILFLVISYVQYRRRKARRHRRRRRK